MRGYIAITSAIIISIAVMAIALALTYTSFTNRFNILDSGFKEVSNGLAEACADTALLKLAQNRSYGGNETISVGSKTCSILPVETISNQKIIKTRATSSESATNIKVIANDSDLSIVSWEEIPKF